MISHTDDFSSLENDLYPKASLEEVFFGSLVASYYGTNVVFSNGDHNLAIFMLAGHKTTATALTIVLYFLATHKNIQSKVHEKLLRVLRDNLITTTEQQRELKYLNIDLHENLRLYSPNLFMKDLRFENEHDEKCDQHTWLPFDGGSRNV
ncbi:2751_t:CDS:2 [Funneliformis geosporum]|uniref:2751_t:CDS:1 n=1 Tax=Funneliformis geosporum TaxID=1117311 RepID=A0A9W4SPH3_9GLOM|nr:2751_t:CDS:2 [Funneliformis geosporum]